MAGTIREWLTGYVVEPLVQIWLLLRESFSLRRILVNRFTVVLAVILLATTGANAFMDNNDGDRLTGTVISEDGTPVENATVTVRVVGIENQIASQEVVTDGSGQFVIEDYSGPADSGVLPWPERGRSSPAGPVLIAGPSGTTRPVDEPTSTCPS